MSLLTALLNDTLDEGYARAAARREAAGRPEPPRTLRARLWLAAGLALAAVVVTLGAAQTQVAAPTVAREREQLLDRVTAATAALDRLQGEVNALGADVAARRNEVLRDDQSPRHALAARLAGATELTGPGLTIVVDDHRAAVARADDSAGGLATTPRDAGFADTGRVRDSDLQRVVNGLWAAGAEAVAVNERRLTARSAIRAAGDAILVDNRPLAPPYTVVALGDGPAMRVAFDASPDGQYLRLLQGEYGIRASTSVSADLSLPAAPNLNLSTARPLVSGDATGLTPASGPGRSHEGRPR